MITLTTRRAISLLRRADCVVLTGNDIDTVATFVGWREEGDPKSGFVVTAEGWDDIDIELPSWDPINGEMRVSGFVGTIKLYKQMKFKCPTRHS